MTKGNHIDPADDRNRLAFPENAAPGFRLPEIAAAEAELRLRAKDLPGKLERLEDAQTVSQEVLQLEFSV
jgi:hypothetical protein